MYRPAYKEVLDPSVLGRIGSKVDDAFGAMPYETVQHFGEETSYMLAKRCPAVMDIAKSQLRYGTSSLLHRSMNYQLGAAGPVEFSMPSDRNRIEQYKITGELAYRQRCIELISKSSILDGMIVISDTQIEGDLWIAGEPIAVPPKSYVEVLLYCVEEDYDSPPMAALELDANSGSLSGHIALQHHMQDNECSYPGSCNYEQAATEMPFAWADPPLSEPEILESILNRARSLTMCLDLLLPPTMEQG